MDFSSINIAAMLDTYVYMDDQNKEYKGETLNTIMGMMTAESKNSAEYSALQEAIKQNPDIGNLVLVSQSSAEHDMNLTVACTFVDSLTQKIYVAYRGTGDGKWLDNGEGMVEASTVMQEEAAKYFEGAIKELKNNSMYNNYEIIVTGHSKGGNLAQYVTLTHSDQVDACYSLDGQGFSSAAINKFIEDMGLEEYYNTLNKMYSVNGENDYVHDLGNVVIPEENTYFVRTPDAEGFDFNGWHNLLFMIDGDELNWFKNSDGTITYGEQAVVGKIVKEVSKEFMGLPEESLYDSAITIMYGLELAMGDEYSYGTGNRKTATSEEVFGFAVNIIPVLAKTFVKWGVNIVGHEVSTLINNLKGTKMYDMLLTLGNWVEEKYHNITAWINNNLNPGYMYATLNTNINVDTSLLRGYAERLTKVNSRLRTLDREMDDLYWKVGFLDLLDLIHADIITGHSWRIDRCVDYLINTAGDFENAERIINTNIYGG